MKCEYYEHCSHAVNDDLCSELYRYCAINIKLKKFGVRMSNSGIEQEVLDMINLNGYIRNLRWHEGEVV